MKYITFLFMLFIANFSFAAKSDLDSKNYTEKGKIILIDKLEENSKKIELSKNSIAMYKNLEITLESCWISPKNRNEYLAKILVVGFDNAKSVDDKGRKIFHGWIANNNKKVSNLKHRLYQIHLFECIAE